MTFQNIILRFGGIVAVSAATACAHSVPDELADARVAYRRAAEGPAKELSPADLHVAETSLAKAEESFDEDGESRSTKDLAYVAQRRAELAEVKARTVAAERSAKESSAAAELARQEALAKTQAQLAEEQRMRAEAEKRAQSAMANLSQIAAVKQEERGTVITVPGAMLFESGKAILSSSAEKRLAQVAEALSTTAPESKIQIEGHTDSQGSKQFNQKLSQSRAEAVRVYLVSHGIAPDRIHAEGFGASQPVASNSTPEGRANNRRVEIVVQPASASTDSGLRPAPTTPMKEPSIEGGSQPQP